MRLPQTVNQSVFFIGPRVRQRIDCPEFQGFPQVDSGFEFGLAFALSKAWGVIL